jgi:hypothetical protein
MQKAHIKRSISIAAVVTGLSIVLIPYSMLIGWNLVTLALFWFIITPLAAFCLPALVLKNNNHLIESLTGLCIFYAIMVLMIYEHYQSDYFLIMMVSLVFNLISVTGIHQIATKKKSIHS